VAWEAHRNRNYYYRSYRVGRQVKREYAGAGLAGQLAEMYAERERTERTAQNLRLRREEAHYQSLDAQLQEVCSVADALVKLALLSAGYHQHDRDRWRLTASA
jgi:hypothetical protein